MRRERNQPRKKANMNKSTNLNVAAFPNMWTGHEHRTIGLVLRKLKEESDISRREQQRTSFYDVSLPTGESIHSLFSRDRAIPV